MEKTVEELKKIERLVDIKQNPLAKNVVHHWIQYQNNPLLKFHQVQFINNKWTSHILSSDGTLEQPKTIPSELLLTYLKGEVTDEERSIDYRLDSFMCNLLGKADISVFEQNVTTKPFYRFVYKFLNSEVFCTYDPSDPEIIQMLTSDPVANNPHPETNIGKSAQQLIEESILQSNLDNFPE